MNDAPSCRLCGQTDRRELGTSLAHWKVALPGMAYEHITSCRDREACKRRVLAQGDVWPLVELSGDKRGVA